MRMFLTVLTLALLAGCVMYTEDGKSVLVQSGKTLLMDFNARAHPGITTESGIGVLTQAGATLLAEIATPVLLTTQAGVTLATESNQPLRM